MKSKKTLGIVVTISLIAALSVPIQAQATGWIENNGKWTYVTEAGQLASNWQMIGDCWYAFETDGTMKTGWVASDEKWYFMGESGVMQESGWISSEGSDYYLKGTGVMATDYVKDGYELDATGKAIPLSQTKSVELTDLMNVNNQTIEGNLYIDATKFKELELSGITVTGKVVIMGEISESKITIKDSTVNTISSQTRGAEVTLSGTTAVKKIEIEENSTIKPGENYTGKVESVEIQSTAQQEVKIEVPAATVKSNTFAPVSINAPVDNLAVNKKTDLKVNADVTNITVNKTAEYTKVAVEKNVTVGSVTSDTKVEVGGAGKVEDIKGEEISNETEKPSKPSTGGDGTDRPTPPVIPSPDGVGVSSEADLIKKIADPSIFRIYLLNDILLTQPVKISEGRGVTLDLNGKVITVTKTGERSLYAFDNFGKLTLDDTSTTKTGKIIARGVQNLGTGELTILAGTYISCDTSGGAAVWNEATLYIEGGLFQTTHVGTSSDEYGAGCVNNSGNAYISGGTFDSVNRRTYAILSTNFVEIKPSERNEVIVNGAHGGLGVDAGKAIIRGGSFSSTEYFGLYVSHDKVAEGDGGSAVVITGGVFDGNSSSVCIGSDWKPLDNSSISILGGTFEKKLTTGKHAKEKAIQVKGGLFVGLDEEFVSDGHKIVAVGNRFEVVEKEIEDTSPTDSMETITLPESDLPLTNIEESNKEESLTD